MSILSQCIFYYIGIFPINQTGNLCRFCALPHGGIFCGALVVCPYHVRVHGHRLSGFFVDCTRQFIARIPLGRRTDFQMRPRPFFPQNSARRGVGGAKGGKYLPYRYPRFCGGVFDRIHHALFSTNAQFHVAFFRRVPACRRVWQSGKKRRIQPHGFFEFGRNQKGRNLAKGGAFGDTPCERYAQIYHERRVSRFGSLRRKRTALVRFAAKRAIRLVFVRALAVYAACRTVRNAEIAKIIKIAKITKTEQK